MATGGFTTFKIDGQEKGTFSYWDGFPCGIGHEVLTWLREAIQDLDTLKVQARALRIATMDAMPTAADAGHVRRFIPEANGDWYDLLHECQRDPALTLRVGITVDVGEFGNAQEAEWNYIIDLDAGVFRVVNSAAGKVGEWPLTGLPDGAAWKKWDHELGNEDGA